MLKLEDLLGELLIDSKEPCGEDKTMEFGLLKLFTLRTNAATVRV